MSPRPIIPTTPSWHPLGSNLIAFQPTDAPRRLQKDRDPCSVRASAEIVPLSSRSRSRLTEPAVRRWPGESNTGEDDSRTRDEHRQFMRENILAIGWLGTFMTVAYCVLTIPMH